MTLMHWLRLAPDPTRELLRLLEASIADPLTREDWRVDGGWLVNDHLGYKIDSYDGELKMLNGYFGERVCKSRRLRRIVKMIVKTHDATEARNKAQSRAREAATALKSRVSQRSPA